MKTIFTIYKNDLKKITRNIIAFIVVIGLSILPALYAWFNIAANWDPYASTGELAVAVVSNDDGYSVKTIDINCGNQIVDNLKKNDKMGWTFLDDEATAIDGVKSGKYYACVIVPKDFTEKLCSLISGKFEQSEIKYYVNEKKNAIAPKITDKGVQAIQEQVDASFVSTITQTIATTLNVTTNEAGTQKEQVINNIVDSLTQAENTIKTFNSTIDVLSSTTDTLTALLKTNKDILPNVSDLLKQSGTITTSVKGAIDSTQSASSQLTSTMTQILASTESMEDDISSQVSSAFDTLGTDSAAAADKLSKTTQVNNKIINVNNTLINILQNLTDTLGIDNSNIINKLTEANTKQQNTIDKINNAASTIKTDGSLPASQQKEITDLIADSRSSISALQPAFTSAKSAIDKAVNSTYDTLKSASGLMNVIDGDIPDISSTLDSGTDALNSMKTTFSTVKQTLYNSTVDIDIMITKINKLKDDTTLENLVNTVLQDPESLGEFVANPVTVSTESLYPVSNYGSSMTPFYTTLAFWVGGIVLVAVLKANLSKSDLRKLKKVNSTQEFFGRYLIFLTLGLIQSLIIALGDIFFLKIQCENIWLFIVASLVSSFVYTLIIYSLTITFSVIGKALSVIFLVIQIAGSGGTFPIEVLPPFFRSLYPFMPFRYGINALREAVAGTYENDFWIDILYLLAFVPVALILGLLLRKPCIKMIAFFNQRVEETDLIA